MLRAKQLDQTEAPRAIPPTNAKDSWMTLYRAEFDDLVRRMAGKPTNPATIAYSRMLVAYSQNDTAEFNGQLSKLRKATAAYQQAIEAPGAADNLAPSERLDATKVRFETFFNHFSPFYYCAATYVLAFIVTACSWLGWSRPLGRTATAIIVVTFLVHTLALVARIYISGRPPVNQLVFFGYLHWLGSGPLWTRVRSTLPDRHRQRGINGTRICLAGDCLLSVTRWRHIYCAPSRARHTVLACHTCCLYHVWIFNHLRGWHPWDRDPNRRPYFWFIRQERPANRGPE